MPGENCVESTLFPCQLFFSPLYYFWIQRSPILIHACTLFYVPVCSLQSPPPRAPGLQSAAFVLLNTNTRRKPDLMNASSCPLVAKEERDYPPPVPRCPAGCCLLHAASASRSRSRSRRPACQASSRAVRWDGMGWDGALSLLPERLRSSAPSLAAGSRLTCSLPPQTPCPNQNPKKHSLQSKKSHLARLPATEKHSLQAAAAAAVWYGGAASTSSFYQSLYRPSPSLPRRPVRA